MVIKIGNVYETFVIFFQFVAGSNSVTTDKHTLNGKMRWIIPHIFHLKALTVDLKSYYWLRETHLGEEHSGLDVKGAHWWHRTSFSKAVKYQKTHTPQTPSVLGEPLMYGELRSNINCLTESAGVIRGKGCSTT